MDKALSTIHRHHLSGVPATAEPARTVGDPQCPGGQNQNIEALRRVLLVEPSQTERWWLRNELLAGQMEIYEATDLISVLRAIPLFKPDLVLSQMRLPTYDGLELVRQLRQETATQSIPIILYSDLATAEERIRAFDLGANDVVSKPFVGAELLARVRAALRTKQLLEILERRAHLDGLTGLANRGVLEERLPREWEICRRRGVPLAILIADIDHFKSINDTHGHAMGDEVLRQTAQVLSGSVRAGDLVARYGGEEFVIVAPNCDLESAVKLGERFRDAIASLRIVEHGQAIPLTTSVGVAVATDVDCITPSAILKQADEALYRAKEASRNATWFVDPIRGVPVAAMALETVGS